jgi:hypothetical protein
MSMEQTPDSGDSGRRGAPARRPAWIAGGVLIVVGIVFIIQNVSGFSLDNWWALFILIPALGSLVTAYQMYERNGRRLTAAARGPLIGGLVLLGVTAVFLFKLNWAYMWPVFLILAGLGMLLGSFDRKS